MLRKRWIQSESGLTRQPCTTAATDTPSPTQSTPVYRLQFTTKITNPRWGVNGCTETRDETRWRDNQLIADDIIWRRFHWRPGLMECTEDTKTKQTKTPSTAEISIGFKIVLISEHQEENKFWSHRCLKLSEIQEFILVSSCAFMVIYDHGNISKRKHRNFSAHSFNMYRNWFMTGSLHGNWTKQQRHSCRFQGEIRLVEPVWSVTLTTTFSTESPTS